MKRAALTIAAFLAAGLPAGCGSDDDSAPGDDLPQGDERVELDPADFRADVDNRYWPMRPGTRWTYREADADGTALRVVVTATPITKKLANGVTARVVRDTVTQGVEVAEDTFDWYAQRDDGTVWYMGEDTAEFEGSKVTSREGSWEAGKDGALPGVAMPAEPRDDMRYRQEYYRGEAEDNGEIISTREQVQVAAGHYRDAVLTTDTTPLEPDVVEYKLYAPGVGPVLTLHASGGGGREELIGITRVGDSAARAAGTAPLGARYP